MNRLEKLNKLQESFVEKFIEAGGNVLFEVATGFGKSVLAFRCLYKLLELEWITSECKIFIFAETKDREEVFKEEALKYQDIFGKNPLNDFNIEFKTYQGKVKKEREVDIYDEMKFGLTAKYHKYLLYPTKYKIGLDAHIPEDLYVFAEEIQDEIQNGNLIVQSDKDTKKGKITKYIKKGQLSSIIIPNRIRYSLEQGIEDGILSPYETIIVNHSLGTKHKYVRIYVDKKTRKAVYGSEQDWYTMRSAWRKNPKKPNSYKAMLSKIIMPKFLYTLKTKAIVINKLLTHYPDRKFLVFGVRKELLYDITPNVCEPENTTELVDKFNRDEIKIIAAAKMIQQGRTLKGLTDIIIVSYYKSSGDLVQRVGRLTRFVEGKIGRVWIIRTKNTFEDNSINSKDKLVHGWFEEMQKVYNSKKELVDIINLNIKKEITSFDLFKDNFKL